MCRRRLVGFKIARRQNTELRYGDVASRASHGNLRIFILTILPLRTGDRVMSSRSIRRVHDTSIADCPMGATYVFGTFLSA